MLNPEQEAELLRLLEAEKRAAGRRKLDTYYPETGSLRRELYIKHMEFFGAGARYKERLFLAANRVGKCCTAATLIETSEGQLPLGFLHWRGHGFKVSAWDRSQRLGRQVWADACAPFQKPGLHHCYRLTLADGRWVEVAGGHLILFDDGQFYPIESLLPRFGLSHLPSSEDSGQSVHVEGAPRLSGTHASLPDCYSQDRRLHGARPRSEADNDRGSALRSADVLPHSLAWLRPDDLGHKHTSSVRLSSARLSIQDAYHRFVDLFAGLRTRTAGTIVECLSYPLQGAAPPHLVSGVQSRSSDGGKPHAGDRAVSDRPSASSRPVLVIEGNGIIACEYIGRKQVFDFEVLGLHNYVAGGLVHHNSEGVGGYEMTLHLTGEYPEWWEGHRFDGPIAAWASGETVRDVRDSLQKKLLGSPGEFGSGLIPGDAIKKHSPRSGVPDAVDTLQVRRRGGGISTLGFKSYDQGREAFQAADVHVVWFDEEPDEAIYTEGLLRTMTTNGLVLCTFTPIKGLSKVVLSFLPDGRTSDQAAPTKYVVMATWEDAPHLTPEQKRTLLAGIPPYQRDARTKGIPALGSGAIYPVPESDFVVDPMELPAFWPRVYGLDVGWNRTAAVWGALDREADCLYLYAEHYRGEAEPPVHAEAIRAKGRWIPGVIDPAARGRGEHDGGMLLQKYIDLGLMVSKADNSLEAGLTAVWMRLSTGRLKVFSSLPNWLREFRLYRRNEKGKVVGDDHLMDATRYLEMSGVGLAQVAPDYLTHLGHRPKIETEYDPVWGNLVGNA